MEVEWPIGRIHSVERPDRAPEEIVARTSGIVCVVRAVGATDQGDCVFAIGRKCEPAELL